MAPNYKDTLRTDKRTDSKNSHKNFNAHHVDGRMAEETFAIIHYVIFSSTGRATNSSPSHVAVKFCKLVNDMLSKHEVFNCICANLDLSPSNITRDFNGVAESMFEDSRINWGRLVALVAFSVKVAEHFRSQGYQSQEDIVVDLASNFIVYKAGPWIVDKGGWVSFLFLLILREPHKK